MCVCVCLAVWAGGEGGCFFVVAVWAGACLFFLLFGRRACSFLAVWVGGVIFFLLFGRGTGVHSLTGLPGSSLSDPTTKKTKQQKKTRVPAALSLNNL